MSYNVNCVVASIVEVKEPTSFQGRDGKSYAKMDLVVKVPTEQPITDQFKFYLLEMQLIGKMVEDFKKHNYNTYPWVYIEFVIRSNKSVSGKLFHSIVVSSIKECKKP